MLNPIYGGGEMVETCEKIVISGYFGFGNLGDEAILAALKKGLGKNLPQAKPVVLSGNPEKTKILHKVESVNRWHLYSLWREIRSSDALISGVGGLFQDITSSRSLWYYLLIICMAWMQSVPVFIMGCGIGPIKGKFNRLITGFFLKKAKLISVRDEKSFRKVKGWGVDRSLLHLGEDLALGLDLNGHFQTSESETQERLLSISLKEPSANRVKFIHTIASNLDQVTEKLKLKAVFLPTHPSLDLEITREIAKKMEGKSEIVDTSDMTPYKVIEAIGKSHLMLGMRLHALEFACLANTPFVAISYGSKIEEFVKTLRVPFPLFWEEEIEEEQIVKAVSEVMARHKFYRKALADRTNYLQKSAQSSLKKVCDEISDHVGK